MSELGMELSFPASLTACLTYCPAPEAPEQVAPRPVGSAWVQIEPNPKTGAQIWVKLHQGLQDP